MYAIRSYYATVHRYSIEKGKLKIDFEKAKRYGFSLKNMTYLGNVITSYSIHYTKLYDDALFKGLDEIKGEAFL